MVSNFLNLLFSELNAQNLQYCVWGNYEYLPDSLNGSDLDIIVKEQNRDDFRSILNKCLFEYFGKIVSYFDTINSEHFRIVGNYQDTYWGIMIDVMYEELYYKGRVYIPSKWIWEFRTDFRGIKVNELNFSYLAGFLKELLHHGNIKDKYFNNLSLGLNKNSNTYATFIKEVYGNHFYVLLLEEIKKGKENINLELLRIVARKSIKSSALKVLSNNIKKVRRLFGPNVGFSVVFLGTDGSGKSTIIEQITPVLNDAFHKAVFYEHMRPNRFPSIAKLLGRKESFDGPVTNPHDSKSSGFLGSLLRWFYYLIDYTIGFYLKVWPKKAIRSCVWLFDRYYYDYLIDPKRGRIKLPYLVLKLGQILIPEPDIILCLGTDAKIIHKRKPELPLNEVENQVIKLKQFCDKNNKAVWIDTGASIENSTKESLNAIVDRMSKRFEDVKF